MALTTRWEPADFTAWPVLVVAGALVGFGTRMGSGCTSGHGVCGVSRLSQRSIVATLSFIAAGIVTVFIQSMIGGCNVACTENTSRSDERRVGKEWVRHVS